MSSAETRKFFQSWQKKCTANNECAECGAFNPQASFFSFLFMFFFVHAKIGALRLPVMCRFDVAALLPLYSIGVGFVQTHTEGAVLADGRLLRFFFFFFFFFFFPPTI